MLYKCQVCKKQFKVSPARHRRAIDNPTHFTPKSCSMACNKIRLKGVRRSPTTQFKKGAFAGEQSPWWKGDKVGYWGLHDWIAKELGKPQECENCGKTEKGRYEWANLSGEYKRDLSDWARLCKRCHVWIDDSLKKAWANHL